MLKYVSPYGKEVLSLNENENSFVVFSSVCQNNLSQVCCNKPSKWAINTHFLKLFVDFLFNNDTTNSKKC